MTFIAEKTDSAGQIFATFKIDASSVHIPIGTLQWGADSGSLTQTDTGSPLPVRLYGNNSAAPVFTQNNSGQPFFVRGLGDSTIPVSGTITVGNDTADPVGVDQIGYVAPSTTFTQSGYVAPSTTITQTDYVAPSTTVTVSNIASNDTVVTVSNIADNDTTVTVTGSSVVALTGTPVLGTALTAVTGALTSTAFDVMTAAGVLYGYSLSNPDTADDVWIKMYADNAAGSTLGESIALLDIMIPFGGGANVSIPQGIGMSSGLSITAAASPGSSVHDAPAAAPFGTFWFSPST